MDVKKYGGSDLKKGYRILSVLLALIFCLSGAVSAMATTYNQAPTQYTLNSWEQAQVESYAKEFRKGLNARKKSISVPVNSTLRKKYGNVLLSRIIWYNTISNGTIHGLPSSYINNSVKVPMSYHNDTDVLEMTPTYYTTWSEEDNAKNQAKKIVSELTLTGSNQNRLYQLTNYILKHYTYDWDKHRTSDSYAYVLKHKQTKMMCGGFAQMLYLMCQAAGISTVMTQNGYGWIWGTQYGPHAWLTYQENNTKYVLDITTAVGNYYFDKKIPSLDKYLLPQGTQNYQNRIPNNVNNVYNIE